MTGTRLALTLAIALSAVGCKKQQPAEAPAPAAQPAPAAPAPAPAPAAAPAATPGATRVEVTVTDKGFEPAKIPAKAGVPLTLAITRKADKTCATEILFEGEDKKTDLPLNKTVEVTYTPKKAGEIKFGCAMGMMIGGALAVVE